LEIAIPELLKINEKKVCELQNICTCLNLRQENILVLHPVNLERKSKKLLPANSILPENQDKFMLSLF
jgi:2,3-bisphosphoglycerate-independent phosphoglycerate mutase